MYPTDRNEVIVLTIELLQNFVLFGFPEGCFCFLWFDIVTVYMHIHVYIYIYIYSPPMIHISDGSRRRAGKLPSCKPTCTQVVLIIIILLLLYIYIYI